MAKAIVKIPEGSQFLTNSLPFGESSTETMARSTVMPTINAARVINAFQGDADWIKLDFATLIDRLQASVDQSTAGNLAGLEAMLITQATALQAVFASLAERATRQNHIKQYETYMGLALKAQSQSRSTISALVDLKYPRPQATFIKQANMANGPQQVVNNTHAAISEPQSTTKLLAGDSHGGAQMDTGTTTATTRRDPEMATLGKLDGTQKPRRQRESRAQRNQARRAVGPDHSPDAGNPDAAVGVLPAAGSAAT